MNKKLIARTAKLHSEPKKGRRFKGIAVSYEYIPTDLEERNHGSIYALVNVNVPTEEAEDVAQLIIDTFHGEFYNNLNQQPAVSLESALARINEELADITHQGAISWLNNLNAILAVLSDNNLHVTQAGKAEVYLYRGDKSSHISSGLAGDSSNPQRTFINIASGELHEGDKIAIVSPGVFYHISKDELKRYVKEFQPKVAISHIADLLEGTTNEMNPNSALIIEMITPEAASNETLDDQPDEIWISEAPKPVETAIETATPFFKKVIEVTKTVWAISTAFVIDKALPFIKNTGSQTKNVYDNWRENQKVSQSKENVLIETDELVDNDLDDNVGKIRIDTKESSTITSPKISTKNEIFIKENQSKPKWLKLERVDFSSIQKIGTGAMKFGKSMTSKYTKDKKKAIIVASAVFVTLVLGVFLLWNQRESAESLKLANASYTEAEGKVAIAKNLLASGDRTQASNNLKDAKSIAENLTKDSRLKDKATKLLAEINTNLDLVENITKPNVVKVADVNEIVGKNNLGPFVIGDNIYIISKENGSIASLNLTNSETANVLDKPEIDGKIVAATTIDSRRIIVIATSTGKLYEFDPTEVTLTAQDAAGDFEKIVAMSSFSTNIYTLTEDGKIYKRTKTSTGYSRSIEYITDNSFVQNAVDIKIDSNIYVTDINGNVTKYLAGKKEEYAVTDLPNKIESTNGLFTNEDTKGLYIINNAAGRVVKLDENGKFITQFASDSFKEIAGTYVDDSTQTVYVLASGTLYKFNF